MAGQKYNKAYEAYQQAVYRDGRNPTFWCSIGVLYFQINQYRDALDAYSRAIRINPYIPEVWFDLGSLYESCNNQIGDAIDAYARAAELDPGNGAITQRLHLLKHSQATGAQLPAAPAPQDVHPTAYASVASTPGLGGLPLLHVSHSGRPVYRPDSREPGGDLPHHPHINAVETSPAPPFRGGPPPPVVIDESRHTASHAQLAPMDVDHIPHGRDAPYSHPPPTRDTRPPRLTSDSHPRESEGMRNAPPHDSYYSRPSRAGSIPPSPPVHTSRPRSPTYHGYPPNRVQVTTGPTGTHRSPHAYPREPAGNGPPSDREAGWDRREWERGRDSNRRHVGSAYLHHGPSPPPRILSPRARSPSQTSPMLSQSSRSYWDSRPTQPPPLQSRSPRAPPPSLRSASGDRSYWQNPTSVESPPESARAPRAAPPTFTGGSRDSESPHLTTQRAVDPAAEYKDRRRRGTREKELEVITSPSEDAPKRDRKRRTNPKQKSDRGRTETPKPYGGPPNQNPPFKVNYAKRDESAGPSSSAASGSQSRSAQPSPTSTVPNAPARNIDEDYDEGVAETLIGLASSSYRAPEQTPTFSNGPAASTGRPISPSPSMRTNSHRGSISSTRSRASPPPSSVATTMKRPLSPGPDDIDPKRSKMEIPVRKVSPPVSASSRPSPPFRTQPSSRSPENRQAENSKHPSYPSSPQLPAVLPLPPRPIGTGLSHTPNTLPPIATLSPTSTSPSPAHEPDRMSIDRTQSRSASPQAQSAPRGKFVEVMNPTEPSNSAEPSS